MSLLIKNILLDNTYTDIYIEENLITSIAPNLSQTADKIIDGSNKAAIPGFVNGHGHAAMTLFRGFGDDMPLEKWLREKIWPYEARLNEEVVYWGMRLACLEMIKSGTTCFNDMYWFFHANAQAVEEMGIRAVLSSVVFDELNPQKADKTKEQAVRVLEECKQYGDRINFAIGPHSIYTVSGETLKWVRQFAEDNNVIIHMHIAETQTEHANSVQAFGLSPVRYLHQLGLLSPRLILAHSLWIDEEEIALMAGHGVHVIHNPNSNLKLGSGYAFKYEELKNAGVNVCLGTDGCSSSNNLDMIEAAKEASFLQKGWRFDPTAMPAAEALKCATENGGKALGLKIGKIEEGYLADISLVDMNLPVFTPNHNFVSNLIYAANGNCIDTVICNGKIIMENKYVPGEEEIISKVRDISRNLFI